MTGDAGSPTAGRRASTSDRLLHAALEAFSTTGFEGTSARQVERLAGVERGLVNYHFGSKQNLWNQAVDLLFDRYIDELGTLRAALRDVSRRERISAMLKAYARFNARNPEFFRILVLEGQVESERSERLAFELQRAMRVFSDFTDLSGTIPVQVAIRWFLVIGAAGTLYSLAAHAERTFGDLLTDPDFVDRFASELAAMALTDVAGDPIVDTERVLFLGGALAGEGVDSRPEESGA